MCIAIYKPQGKRIDWDSLREAERINDDGWGFAARTSRGHLIVRRGIDHFAGFQRAFEQFIDHQCIIHFRIRTAGDIKKPNCHPFMVSDSLAVIHNGMVPIACNVKRALSDTWHFNELVLREFYKSNRSFWRRAAYKFVIEQMSGGSKFVFLRGDGAYAIYNESLGHWLDGVWYSNRSYECRRVGYYTQPQSRPSYGPRWERRQDGSGRFDLIEQYWDSDSRQSHHPDVAKITDQRQSEIAFDDKDEQPTLYESLPEEPTESESSKRMAQDNYERQCSETRAASTAEASDEKQPADEEEEAGKLWDLLVGEGLSPELVTELHDVFGLEGLMAIAELIPDGLEGN